MNTRAAHLTVDLVAHEGPEGKLLLGTLTADEAENDSAPLPHVAFVVDRSGSMDGAKLESVKRGLASFLRSLGADDRVALVTFDDKVEILSHPVAPSEALARLVEGIETGGSTNLYGGWVAGAKALAPGGRVVLLSDGQANAGRYTAAEDLARHARLTYERYRITTTTLGIGGDYDEALMAGMARAGGGAHYFAHDAGAIAEALGQERYALGAVALSHVSLRYGAETRALGHFWGGETKRVVLRVDSLGGDPATVRYTLAATGVTSTVALAMPRDFGHSDEATLELLLLDASMAESEAAAVRDPRAAGASKTAVRALLLRLLAHPLADAPLAAAVRAGLEATLARLELLERRYDEGEAALHRKRSYQTVHNLSERAKAYSSFGEDEAMLGDVQKAGSSADESPANADPDALALLPAERWAAFPALPIRLKGRLLIVALEKPRDGFLVAEIEKATGLKVKPNAQPLSEAAIRAGLGV